MKVTLLVDCQSLNPEYDPEDPDSPQLLTRPAGEIIDHPDAWKLCVPERLPVMKGNTFTGKFISGQIRAEPADDDARSMLTRRRPDVARQLGLITEQPADPPQASAGDSTPKPKRTKARGNEKSG